MILVVGVFPVSVCFGVSMRHVTPLAVSPDEAAALLGVSPRTMYRQIAAGKIRVGRVGRRVLVSRAEIERLLGLSEAPRPMALRRGGVPSL